MLPSPSPLKDWKLLLPAAIGTLLIGAGVGAFLGSVHKTTGIIPTVATGMMVSFIMGGLASWLDSKRQLNGMKLLSALALLVGIWAGGVNLAIAAALAPMALWDIIWPTQAVNWAKIAALTSAGGAAIGGVITGMVLTQAQVQPPEVQSPEVQHLRPNT